MMVDPSLLARKKKIKKRRGNVPSRPRRKKANRIVSYEEYE